MYFKRIPNIIKRLFPSIIWDLPNTDNKIYLTFDDGPHPEITPWILQQLKKYNAKATFFCLGKNVEKYPEIAQQIITDGHTIGNHGYAHLNGWITSDDDYLEDYFKSEKILKQSRYLSGQNDVVQVQVDNAKAQHNKMLFRPAYGKIKISQISLLKSHFSNINSEILILNWSLMPGDFDENITSEECFKNLRKAKQGDVIVLHDNKKSWKHLEYCLPKFLDFIYNKGLKSDCITL